MWKRQIIWILVLSLLVGTASASICEDRLNPGQNCMMLTPALSCGTYTYDVLSTSGQIISNATLTNLNQSVYYFIFNQSQGDYIIRLCDNSTRQIRVTAEDDLNSLPIMLFLLILPISLIILALFKERFVKYNPLNTLIRGALYTIGTGLFAVASSVAWHIADVAGLGVATEVSIYFYVALYLCIPITFLFAFSTFFKFLEELKVEKKKERGEDEQEED